MERLIVITGGIVICFVFVISLILTLIKLATKRQQGSKHVESCDCVPKYPVSLRGLSSGSCSGSGSHDFGIKSYRFPERRNKPKPPHHKNSKNPQRLPKQERNTPATAQEGNVSATAREGNVSATAQKQNNSATAQKQNTSAIAREQNTSDTAQEQSASDTAQEQHTSATAQKQNTSATAQKQNTSAIDPESQTSAVTQKCPTFTATSGDTTGPATLDSSIVPHLSGKTPMRAERRNVISARFDTSDSDMSNSSSEDIIGKKSHTLGTNLSKATDRRLAPEEFRQLLNRPRCLPQDERSKDNQWPDLDTDYLLLA